MRTRTKVLLGVLLALLFAWNGANTYYIYTDYVEIQKLQEYAVRTQMNFNVAQQVFSEMYVWAGTVEQRLQAIQEGKIRAYQESYEENFQPVQYPPRRDVRYLRVFLDDKTNTYTAVGFPNSNLLCIVNTTTGAYTCEVP